MKLRVPGRRRESEPPAWRAPNPSQPRFYHGTQLSGPKTASVQPPAKPITTGGKSLVTRWRRRLALLVILAAVGSRLYVGSLTVTGDGASPTVQETANQYLRSRPWTRIKLLFDGDGFARYLGERHPVIGVVEVRHGLLSGSADVITTRREPMLVWFVSSKQSWLVDEQGIAYERLPVGEKRDAYPLLSDEERLPVQQGSAVLSPGTASWINSLVQQGREQGLGFNRITIGTSPRHLEVRAKGLGYRLKLTTERGAGEQLADLKQLQEYLRRRSITPRQYVDLRVAGRAYYR